jgi:L-lactate utilization protein LutC
MIFAREVSDPLTSLVKKIDEATAKTSDCRMGSFVVFCSDAEGLEKQLKELAEKQDLKKVVLSIDNPSGPPDYKVAKDADVTVVLYTKHSVKANHAFKKGELKVEHIEKVLKDVSKIVPKDE